MAKKGSPFGKFRDIDPAEVGLTAADASLTGDKPKSKFGPIDTPNKPPPGGPPKPPTGAPKPEPAASGGPKKGPEKAASTRTPEQAVADKATLRKVIAELDSAIATGGLGDAAVAVMKTSRAERQKNLDELLEQFPDSGIATPPTQGETYSTKLKEAAAALKAAGLFDQAKEVEDKIQKLDGTPTAKPAESPKPAEAAKPAEVKLTPEQQALTDQVTAAAWLKPDEKNNFNAAIKGAKDPAELQRIEHSMNVLRDL